MTNLKPRNAMIAGIAVGMLFLTAAVAFMGSDVEDEYNRGVSYYSGEGVGRDFREAVKWYRKAAEQGYARAQFNLGVCYDNGEGVDQDCREAARWYRMAAAQGHAKAQCNLGWCHVTGRGVTQDRTEGVKWLRKAAAQGDERAKEVLRTLGD